ncbi:MAG: HAD family hydrolase [Clostridiales bacterium]|nr:HAD family hydrolase [Clostridiales bacterium]
MKYNTIIFDLDGTLLNTLEDLAASVNYAMRECGFAERTTDEVRRFVGNGVHVLIRRAAPKDITEEQYWDAYNHFEKHYAVHHRDKTAPYDGITELLTELKKRGYSLSIVSNKIDFAVKALREEFFSGLIDVAVGDCEDTANKPAPDMVHKAMRQLGAEPEGCIYVGDTDVDIETAQNAEMPCISVSWGFRSREELVGYGAEMIADKPSDILNFV